MRLSKGLLVSLMAVALAGCDGHSSAAPPGGPSPGGGPPGGGPSPRVTSTEAVAAPPSPASPQVEATARAAATRFYGLYFARQFASSWDLLAPAAKRQIPKNTWTRVHEGCLPAGTGTSGAIKSVTVFGRAAIVTETVTGSSAKGSTVQAVFNYVNGRWSYSPGDLSIYHHGSVSADIAAAKAAGFCVGRNNSIL